MTNNPTIDGVSRELLERILSYAWFPSGAVEVFDLRLVDREELRALLDAPSCQTCSDSGAVGNILNVQPCPDCAALAPAFERKEPLAPFYISVDDWNLLVRGDVEIASVRVSRTRRSIFTESLFAHPSALQSTIAQLQARITQLESEKELMLRGAEVYKERIAELESGRGEADAWALVNGGGLIRDLTDRWDVAKHWDGDIRSLYFDPPAPVAVVLPERMEIPDQATFNGGNAYYAKCFDEARSWNACLDATAALNGPAK